MCLVSVNEAIFYIAYLSVLWNLLYCSRHYILTSYSMEFVLI